MKASAFDVAKKADEDFAARTRAGTKAYSPSPADAA